MKKSNEIIFGLSLFIALSVILIPTLWFEQQKISSLPKDLPRADFLKDKPKALTEPHMLSELKQTDLGAEFLSKKSDADQIQQGGYTIQVGTFSLLQDATSLVEKLQMAGYPAYIRQNRTDKTSAIFVGPQLQKADALKLKTALELKFNLKGNIVYYVPTDMMKENTQ